MKLELTPEQLEETAEAVTLTVCPNKEAAEKIADMAIQNAKEIEPESLKWSKLEKLRFIVLYAVNLGVTTALQMTAQVLAEMEQEQQLATESEKAL